MKIVLATASPYRQRAFEFLGIPFETEASNIEEKFDDRPQNPEGIVKTLAKMKAETVAKNHSEGIVIGFDSVGYFNESILEKPKSREESLQRLKQLSGEKFQFYTGIHLINLSENKTISKVSKTDVWMRNLSDDEINRYLDADKRFMTYALGFDPEASYSSTFAEKIKGSYNNLIRGIPLEMIAEALKELGVIK